MILTFQNREIYGNDCVVITVFSVAAYAVLKCKKRYVKMDLILIFENFSSEVKSTKKS